MPHFRLTLTLLALLTTASPAVENTPLFARGNTVAWCIVPFDGLKRTPAARAAMVRSLGLTKVAYDWRAEHVAEFEREILEYQRNGIELFAFWNTHDDAFRLFAKHNLRPQIWQTAPSPDGVTPEERVAAAEVHEAKVGQEVGRRRRVRGEHECGGGAVPGRLGDVKFVVEERVGGGQGQS